MIVPRAVCWRSVRPLVSMWRVICSSGICAGAERTNASRVRRRLPRLGSYHHHPVRILAIGNMYPPHHLGGYELIWQATMREATARGHAVRVLTSDFRRAGAAGDHDERVHRELRWYWRDHGW